MSRKTLTFLIAESEPPEARDTRRDSVGQSSGETYQSVLRHIVPDAQLVRIKPVDDGDDAMDRGAIEAADAVILTGSPLHLHKESAEGNRVIDFMRAVFAAGTPSFGSCAGLQVAAVAAGGTVRAMEARREAGFARRLYATDAGRSHPLLDGRPPVFDAPAIHTDEVETLPNGATLLCTNATTKVQAAEIRHGAGVFWGVQYHPEISLFEVAAALRRQADDLIEHDLARDEQAVESHAALIEALHHAPERRDLAWRLGLDDEVVVPERRTAEIRNFIEHLVKPTCSARGRA
ncbi:type 1 glutamine amidotransferase [Sphingomonas dokdonensis]|uniref:Gamma-glutamyl-L-1-hydroxyisopropylamide hydrolase n=1 Tax=Sphingomonas dokdonensis TaxID=344880 RepID=A0A245ZJX2_9SPHN|nr:type 1 glutamine amidotransferase [Sphingomonas dokdonensis]OWK30025.1 gamma-glutamyl-L-1-hydroxyisopropylamide hydrolase [Sphingomonas dokdonensis]